ncbi:glycosyltransferase family 2 protein [soil metagenome]
MTLPSTFSVGVIIAAYNAEDSVARAVRSALEEPEVTEVWLVDDKSPDQTVASALAADDGTGRLHLIRQKINLGPAAARNRALAQSRAKWVCVLDADDYFLPGRIGRLLARSADADLVADELIRVHETDETPVFGDFAAAPAARSIDLAAFIAGNVGRKGETRRELGFIKPLMRRDLLTQLGLVYETGLRLGEDYMLYATALARGARLNLSPPLGYVAVVRPDSLSGRHDIEDLRALRDSDDQIAALRPLTPSERDALSAHRTSVDKRLQWRRLIEAVKARDAPMAASTFTSLPVAASLIGELWTQVLERTGLKPVS